MCNPLMYGLHISREEIEKGLKKKKLSQTAQIKKEENSTDSMAFSRTSELVEKLHSNNFYYSREKRE